MLKRVFGAALLALSLFAAPVVAADLIIDAPAEMYNPAPASGWEGFYIGAFAGGRAGNIANTACVGTCANNIALNGLYAGLTAGYDFQFDQNWVIGAFVTVPLFKPTGSATTGGITFTVSPNWAVAAGARVGYDMGAWLPYAIAGVGVANVTVTPVGALTPSSATHVGAVLGAGVEYKITDQISLDGRYMLGLLGSAQYDFCPAGPGNCKSSYNETSHNFSIGVNYRF